MRVGVAIKDTSAFFNEIFAELQAHYQVSLFEEYTTQFPFFKERINRYVFKRNLTRFLESNQIVYFEWAGELLMHASRLPKTCKVVTRIHRYEMYQWVEQINWDFVDKVIVVSEAKREEFAKMFPAQAAKLVVIPEGVSLDRFQPFEKQYQGDIGTLCHLIPRKRVYELVLAFYELVQQHPEFHLHIGGGKHGIHAEYHEALHTLVRRLEIEDRVTFYGNVTDPQNWYRNLDIFVSNSFSEGLQVALLEAMASGIFSLSHHWEGAEEILPTQNLFFTDTQLIQEILAYHNCSLADKQGIKASMRAAVENHSDLTEIVARNLEVVQNLAQEPSTTQPSP